MKKLLLIIFIILAAAASGIWYYRYEIFQFSAENIIQRMLPGYVRVDRIIFDLEGKTLEVEGFAIRNPAGFQNRYLATISSVKCVYRMRGGNILDGIEITDIEAIDPVINIERLSDGRLNVNEVGAMMAEDQPKKVAARMPEEKIPDETVRPGRRRERKISDVLGLTDLIKVTNGRFTFVDKAVGARPFYLTFEDVNGQITLNLNNDYTEVLGAGTRGEGFINGDRAQPVKWVVHLDPTTPELTMSNRIEPENIDIMLFKPYYDRYSPIDIKGGRFSGSLVFDFDNGNIGSTNVLRLRGLEFTEKPGGFASGFWEVRINDIVRYLETSPGEIVFDFKIKGPMRNPRFYPGPNVSRAIRTFAIDTISGLIRGPAPDEEQTSAQEEQRPRSDTEIVLDVIQSLIRR